MQKELMVQLVIAFVITQTLGLYTAYTLIPQEVRAVIVTDNPEDVSNAFGIIVYILVATAILLLGIKFIKGGILLRTMEALAVFGTTVLVFQGLLGDYSSVLGLGIIIARWKWKEHLLLHNSVSTIASAGVGALLGISLGMVPVIVLIALMSAYDLIAVFKTKHMITLAKAVVKEKVAFTYAFPTPKHIYQLGTGDMVMPLTLSSSALHMGMNANNGLLTALQLPVLILIASLVGLLVTLEIAERKQQPLPALPLQGLLMILVWALLTIF